MEYQTVCECGCRAPIRRWDNDPFFKAAPCQDLWRASLEQPEAEQSMWRAWQRHLNELWFSQPWNTIEAYYVCDDEIVVQIANQCLYDLDADMRKFGRDEVEDCYRVLAFRYDLIRRRQWGPPWVMVPEWAKVQQAKTHTQAAYWTVAAQASTLDGLSATLPNV